ncbi:hypothetical protein BH09SUM1_BH09SUM1_32670 [soil metagenome]
MSGTIVAFAPGVWGWPHFAGSPRYHLWTLAGMGWRVLYVEPPVKLRVKPETWKAPDREFHVLKPALIPPFAMRFARGVPGAAWRRLVSMKLAGAAMAEVRRLDFAPDIFWFGAPWHGDLPLFLPKAPLRVSHTYDELSESPTLSARQSEMLWRWEQTLHRECAIVLCSSLPQKQRREGLAAETVLLENAVRDDFLEPPKPSDHATLAKLRALPHPRYVYGGVADLRLDPRLFAELLNRIREGSLVFLGAKTGTLDSNFAAISLSPRTHFLGAIPYDLFPALYAESDVLLIGHLRNAFTDAMYPEKLNEYLASGKPVVSIDLPEVARVASTAPTGAIRVVATATEFANAAIAAAAEADSVLQEERRAIARQRTWSVMGALLDTTLRTALAKRKGTP